MRGALLRLFLVIVPFSVFGYWLINDNKIFAGVYFMIWANNIGNMEHKTPNLLNQEKP